MIEIIISPCEPLPHPKRWAGMFDAIVNGRVVCRSRQPFLDGARVLLAEGCPPDTVLVMRHSGSNTVALKAHLGVAAGKTVSEDVPRFTSWSPFNGSAAMCGGADYAPNGAKGTCTPGAG